MNYLILCIKNQLLVIIIVLLLGLASCIKNNLQDVPPNVGTNTASFLTATTAVTTTTSIPAGTDNKVAYFTFDATPTGNPAVKLSLLNFANQANIVVIFEGSAWELADTVHYGSSSSLMLSGYYKNYRSIINDINTLKARGIKILMNVDDVSSWNTTTPFTTYNGNKQTYQQFAAFVKNSVTDQLKMDGIALDVEHLGNTAANVNYINLLKEFGKYYGPKSSSPTTTIYTAAIYDGAQAGYAIGQSTDVAGYMNFVEDDGYFEDNESRFYNWADYIGAGKTMDGLVKDYNDQSNAIDAAKFQPTNGTKAGIMVFAANADSAYCNNTFRALTTTSIKGVTFYQNTSYGGAATSAIAKGSYTLSQLNASGFVKNWASSVQLPAGWKVTMYKGDNFTGTSWVVTSNTPDFKKLVPSANDVVTSVKIE